MEGNISLKIGTASGTLLSVLPNIQSEDYARTIVLAIIGAATGAIASFVVTWILKWLSRMKSK
jgi:high-affinity Fe2+/Pb2+ permease